MNKKHSDTQNLILAFALSLLIMLYWQYFVEKPRQTQQIAAHQAHIEAEQARTQQDIAEANMSREELLAESPRIQIQSPSLHGSIELRGLRFNDLTLAQYHETLDPHSKDVTLFSPSKAQDTYFAELGWLSDNKSLILPAADTLWSTDNNELTPAQPVNLSWSNGQGITFLVTIAMDSKYMFTINATTKDATGKPVDLQNYVLINRVYDIKSHPSMGILHEGPLGVFDGILHEVTYKKLTEAPYNDATKQKEIEYPAQSGWAGITDKYWLAAVIPSGEPFTTTFSYYQLKERDHYQAYMKSDKTAPSMELHLFAGAKEMALLDEYSAHYNIPLFDHAVDLGLFDFLTKPILKLLTYFYNLTGNFGIAILLLTVLVKLLMYPMASKSFRSMNQMKKLQPKMAEIKERYKDDRLKVQQETMELYKREKINPASGCLPMFVQIPVFFSLYKVLYVTLEMRQAPFFGWIHDLSAPDPTNVFTLFGLIAWNPPAFMHLGIWPIIMCITMVIQQHQSPPPADPAQAKMMKFLPLFFLFLFSSFASGLVIYWSWSNTLTILQQWYIKRKHADDK